MARYKHWPGNAWWQLMNGRSSLEMMCDELQSGFAFAAVSAQSYTANSDEQLLNLMAFSLNRTIQASAIGETR